MLLLDCVATLPSFLHVMLCPRPGPFSGSRSRAVVDREAMYPTRVAGTVTGVSVAFIVFTGGSATLRPRLARGRARSQTEDAHRVVLHDQRHGLVLDAQLFEVPDPAFGGDEREVRTEQRLVLE